MVVDLSDNAVNAVYQIMLYIRMLYNVVVTFTRLKKYIFLHASQYTFCIITEKTRDELRVQVYDAMAEEEKNGEKADSDKNTVEETGGGEEGQTVNGRVNGSDTTNGEEKVIGEKGDKAETKESSDNPEEEDGGLRQTRHNVYAISLMQRK